MTISQSDIQALYIAYFNRPADALGLQFWTNAATQAGSVAVVANAFSASAEYTTTYAGKSPTAIVDQIYMNLFGRHAEPAGLLFWGNALESGQLNVGNIAYQIFQGAQDTVGGFQDKTAVSSKVAAANAFNTAMNNDTTGAAIRGYDGAAADATVKTWLSGVVDATSLAAATTAAALNTVLTNAELANVQANSTTLTLTTGVDNLVATSLGQNTFYGAIDTTANVATFGGADSITGAGTTNTLVLTDAKVEAAAMPIGATVTDIQTITLKVAGTAGDAATATAFDVSGIAGLKAVNVVSADNTGIVGDDITAAATTDISDTSNGAGNQVVTAGGHNVTVVTSGVVDIGYSNAGALVAANAAAGAVNVTDTGAGAAVNVNAVGAVTVADKGATTIVGGTSIATSTLGAKTYATQHADVAADNAANAALATAQQNTIAAEAEVTALGTMITAVATASAVVGVNGAQNGVNGVTLAAELAGTITQAQRTAIDAAYYNALNATGGTAVLGLAAAAVVEASILATATAAQTAAQVISNDTATAGSAFVAVGAADTVVANDVIAAGNGATVTATNNTALASVSVVGNYAAEAVAGPRVSTVGVTIADGSASDTTLTSVSLTNTAAASLTGNGLTTVSLTDEVNNVTIVNAAIGHTETLNLNNVKGSTIADAAATTVNLVTSGTASDHFTLTAGAATAVNISGTVGVTLTADTLASNAVVTAAVGGNTVTLTSTDATHQQSFVGGTTGGNTITIASGVAEAVTINAGSGGNNTLVLGDVTGVNFGTAAAAAKFVGFNTLEVLGGVTVADVTTFTGSTFTAFEVAGAASIGGIVDTAGPVDVTAVADATLTLGITGAATPGQIDTVHLTADSGDGGGSLITLTAPVMAGVEILHLTAVDNVAITSLAGTPALTNLNIDGAGTVDITFDLSVNANTVINAATNTGGLTLNAATSSTFGLSITGSATAANVITTSSDATLTNTITGGDGGDTIVNHGKGTIHDGNGTNTITADVANTIVTGDGANTISAAYGSTITAGNGDNAITVATGTGNSTLTVGTGSNFIALTSAAGTAGVLSVTLGAHTAATGIDTISVGLAGTAFATKANLIVTGAAAGDHIVFAADVNANTVLTAVTAGATAAATITAVEAAAAAGIHDVAYAVFNGITYVAENNAGAAAAAANTTLIELVGTHTIHSGTGFITIVS